MFIYHSVPCQEVLQDFKEILLNDVIRFLCESLKKLLSLEVKKKNPVVLLFEVPIKCDSSKSSSVSTGCNV